MRSRHLAGALLSTTDDLTSMGRDYWFRAGLFAASTALVVAIPTRLIPNGFFRRMTPTRPQDYVFLAVSSVLLGLTFAVRSPSASGSPRGAFAGGLATYLAVGCPICNKLVVALLGTGGALTYFAPFQPVIGIAALVLLWFSFSRRLCTFRAESCPVPRSET